MSCSYAEGLSPYDNKGKLGLPEQFDQPDKIRAQVEILAQWIRDSPHTVVHTGAGISTAAGIPDFRGPQGVWTLERQGRPPPPSLDWDSATPTFTHRALAVLTQAQRVQFVISQNIDGLHMRSSLSRRHLAELHGNMFVDQCTVCQRQFVRAQPAATVGQKVDASRSCPAPRPNGRRCRGKLADFVLDWEAELPEHDLDLSLAHSTLAHLSIVMGSTLQIIPAGNLPTYAPKFHSTGKLVIINLQPTKHDKKADLIIRGYVDEVMKLLMTELTLPVPDYQPTVDPVAMQLAVANPETFIEWTQDGPAAEKLTEMAQDVEKKFKLKRKAAKDSAQSMLGKMLKKAESDDKPIKTEEESLESKELKLPATSKPSALLNQATD
ncbi:hypothetical protein TCAL_10814 [Tigriopus californicus]|uniref:protein acetyllysine N-acetyltransferase n=1 Tax=Tigriopus californicus TaxID=6832 RepID=A0A553NB50_TIGCA|nr:NAD-dependent protein deacetylase Sirt6-like [Tigriopus californicus]TRY62671.1 hypothetical protein TCAL_10814 [Tigriopus californicus]|eukprot:TCALIF_10814-PA protein Name:"Similar to Sirt6 NAD-dependent protein deacetylase Sirt6 (Drosophila melanogaster)" AED:0.03 eAED:0.03 QI:0/-1/0/1/-1/1/1/0/379